MNFIVAVYVLGVLAPEACHQVHRHVDAIDAILARPNVWKLPATPSGTHLRYLEILRNSTDVLCGMASQVDVGNSHDMPRVS